MDLRTLEKSTSLGLLDSALHAPASGFGELEYYSTFPEKVASLCYHIARNHALLDGNKRLAWMASVQFAYLNGFSLSAPVDDAVATVLKVAAGDSTVEELTMWMGLHLRSVE